MRAMFLLPVVLCCGPALADTSGLSITGDARMGIVWERPAAAPGSDRADARLYARTRLKLKLRGQTDGGLTYGAEIDLDNPTGQPAGRRIFIGG